MLLATLKREKLVLEWRKKQQARAKVQVTIEEALAALPDAYSADDHQQKSAEVYQHVFDHYASAERTNYERAA